MVFTMIALFVGFGLFAGMMVLLEVGRRWGLRRAAQPEDHRENLGGVEAAIYGLLGLLVAFPFSGAASRFEGRRELIVKEANAIGTAYLRLDLLSDEARDSLRQKLRDYLDARLDAYRK